MLTSTPSYTAVKQVSKYKITDVDFNALTFGEVFTDHMYQCTFKDGKWQKPSIVPYGDITLSPATKVFHYGQAVFEGMKAYKDASGDVFLFRPEENFKRINASSKRMAIPEFPKNYFFEALDLLLNLDKDWIQTGTANALYIRPFVMATQIGVSASVSNAYTFYIIMCPVSAYYNKPLRVVVAEQYSRSADGGVGYAKAAGNYGAQFYPTQLARDKGFDQVIWTDSNTHNYLEEAGTMNIFFRINNTLVTAPTSERILDGITRKSVLELATHLGISCEVRPLTISEIVEAATNGTLKEIFGSGTAAVISPVEAFNYRDTTYELPIVTEGYATQLKTHLIGIQHNLKPDPFGWKYKI